MSLFYNYILSEMELVLILSFRAARTCLYSTPPMPFTVYDGAVVHDGMTA